MTTANSFRVDRYSVFGADLDLTLLDTRRATAAALHLMNLRCGERVDIEAFVARLGPPVRQITLMPGAADLAAQLRRRGGRLIVITSRIQPIAEVCLASARLVPDAVIGDHVLDMEAALAAGVPGIGVTTGCHDAKALEEAGATAVVASLSTVVAALR